MTTPSSSAIGVVGSDDIASMLASAGIGVVTAPDFSAAATAVASAVRTGGLSAVVVVDGPSVPVGARMWLRSTANRVPTAVVRSGEPSANLPAQELAREFDAATPIFEVLTHLGVAPDVAGRVAPPSSSSSTALVTNPDLSSVSQPTHLEPVRRDPAGQEASAPHPAYHPEGGPTAHFQFDESPGTSDSSASDLNVPPAGADVDEGQAGETPWWQGAGDSGHFLGGIAEPSWAQPGHEPAPSTVPSGDEPSSAAPMSSGRPSRRDLRVDEHTAQAATPVAVATPPSAPSPEQAAPIAAMFADSSFLQTDPAASDQTERPIDAYSAAPSPDAHHVQQQHVAPSSDRSASSASSAPEGTFRPVSAPTPSATSAEEVSAAPADFQQYETGPSPAYRQPFAEQGLYEQQAPVGQHPDLAAPGYAQQQDYPQTAPPQEGYTNHPVQAEPSGYAPVEQSTFEQPAQQAQPQAEQYAQHPQHPQYELELGSPAPQAAEPAAYYPSAPSAQDSAMEYVQYGQQQQHAPQAADAYGQAQVSHDQYYAHPEAPHQRQGYVDPTQQHQPQHAQYVPSAEQAPEVPYAYPAVDQQEAPAQQATYPQTAPMGDYYPPQSPQPDGHQYAYSPAPQESYGHAPVTEQHPQDYGYTQQVEQTADYYQSGAQGEPQGYPVHAEQAAHAHQAHQAQETYTPAPQHQQQQQQPFAYAGEVPAPTHQTSEWGSQEQTQQGYAPQQQAPEQYYPTQQQQQYVAAPQPQAQQFQTQPAYQPEPEPAPAPAAFQQAPPPARTQEVAAPDRGVMAHDAAATAMDALGQVAAPVGFHQPAPAPNVRSGQKLAKVVIPVAGKGGVGKSTSTLALAQRAATMGPEGYRVVVIDANRGQGDLRTFLRLSGGTLPTIYDAVLSGNPADAIVSPSQINAVRGEGWGHIGFAFVAAPPPEAARPDVVGADAYRKVIDYARTIADLVVIDTQIAESHDTSGLFDQALVPLLAGDAYALGVSEVSTASVMNLLDRLKSFQNRGLDRERTLIALNMATKEDQASLNSLRDYLSTAGRFVGAIPTDPALRQDMHLGKPVAKRPSIGPVADAVLYAATGVPNFAPSPRRAAAAIAEAKPAKGGLLGRLRR